ncbi:MAG TPA: DUF1508 domain-containing protein [Candidatus Sulfotelmatobacter sp.]|nr:DUF1508 domain-containing protein [Candidatus Sulfotelmatobacter sp.]
MADIVETAELAGSFKKLIGAVQAAGLTDTLKSKGPFTVFAPDDDAFDDLSSGAEDDLFKNVPKLKAVLLYHVIDGKYTVDEISHMDRIKTLQGQELEVDAHKWHLHMNPKINDAKITSKDVVADNGMIHVLNKVLMPNMDLTCPEDGMGFMSEQELKDHTDKEHKTEKISEPTPQIEKAATAEVPAQPQKPTEPTKIVEPIGTAEVTETTVPISEAVKSREGFFEILCDTSGIFRFILKAPNGEIIAVSECYGTKQAALKGIAAIKKDAPIAKIVDERPANLKELGRGPAILEEPVFEILCDISGKVRFHLKAKNGRIIAASESYCTKQAAEKGIASIKKNATNARIVDHTTLA